MILYDFYADWCSPCKIMAPIIDQIEAEYPEIEVVRINADENPETASDFNISSIPTFVLVDGTKETRVVGAMPKNKFLTALGLEG